MVNDDFLDEMIAERSKVNPEFPRLLEAAARSRVQGTRPVPASDVLGDRQDPK